MAACAGRPAMTYCRLEHDGNQCRHAARSLADDMHQATATRQSGDGVHRCRSVVEMLPLQSGFSSDVTETGTDAAQERFWHSYTLGRGNGGGVRSLDKFCRSYVQMNAVSDVKPTYDN